MPKKRKSGKSRKPRTVYEAIVDFGLERKLIDISVSKAQVPNNLYDDAAQEIRITWMGLPCKESLSMGEIASYAHRVAFHTALKLRRDMGGAVRLPGSAFRKKKDGTTYVQPGHLAAPVPWDDLAEVLETEDDKEEVSELRKGVSLLEILDERCSQEGIEGYTPLTAKQKRMLELLRSGCSFDQIEETMGVRRSTIHRNIREVMKRIQSLKELGIYPDLDVIEA